MSAVPGTFKNRPPSPRRNLSVQGSFAEKMLLDIGAVRAECYSVGDCSVMCAREPFGGPGEYRWHVTVAHPSRYPTWDEIKTAIYGIKTIALPDGRTFAQLLGNPGAGTWVNAHENCFHFFEIEDPWR